MFLFSVYLNSSHTSCLSIMYIVYSNYLFRLLYCVEFNKATEYLKHVWCIVWYRFRVIYRSYSKNSEIRVIFTSIYFCLKKVISDFIYINLYIQHYCDEILS